MIMISEDYAKKHAIKTTKYCYVLACAWEGKPKDSICLERIFVKGGQEEIRLAWWNKGKQAPRPADVDAINWTNLFKNAIIQNVFNDTEKMEMLKAILS